MDLPARRACCPMAIDHPFRPLFATPLSFRFICTSFLILNYMNFIFIATFRYSFRGLVKVITQLENLLDPTRSRVMPSLGLQIYLRPIWPWPLTSWPQNGQGWLFNALARRPLVPNGIKISWFVFIVFISFMYLNTVSVASVCFYAFAGPDWHNVLSLFVRLSVTKRINTIKSCLCVL